MLRGAVQRVTFSSTTSSRGSAAFSRSSVPSSNATLCLIRQNFSSVHDLYTSQPEPMVALAYDYDDTSKEESDMALFPTDSYTSEQFADVSSTCYSVTPTNIKNSAGGRIPTSSTTTSASNDTFTAPSLDNKGPLKKGTGGGGRNRCPKCRNYVTFRHADFEENTFYCANCSGWFLITPNSISADNVVKSDSNREFAKTNENEPNDPQILMQHVSFLLRILYFEKMSSFTLTRF